MRTFNRCQNQRPWMILKDYYALCYAKFAYFGAKDKNVNEDRPILSEAKI